MAGVGARKRQPHISRVAAAERSSRDRRRAGYVVHKIRLERAGGGVAGRCRNRQLRPFIVDWGASAGAVFKAATIFLCAVRSMRPTDLEAHSVSPAVVFASSTPGESFGIGVDFECSANVRLPPS